MYICMYVLGSHICTVCVHTVCSIIICTYFNYMHTHPITHKQCVHYLNSVHLLVLTVGLPLCSFGEGSVDSPFEDW